MYCNEARHNVMRTSGLNPIALRVLTDTFFRPSKVVIPWSFRCGRHCATVKTYKLGQKFESAVHAVWYT